MKHRLLRFD